MNKERERVMAAMMRAFTFAVLSGVFTVAMWVSVGGELFNWASVLLFGIAFVTTYQVGWIAATIARRS